MKIIHFFTAFLPIILGLSCGGTQNKQAMNNPKVEATAKSLADSIQQIGCPDSHKVQLDKGQIFRLKLRSYPSRGYSWALDMDAQTLKKVVLKGKTVEEPNPDTMDDAPTYNIFTFTGIVTGEETVKFRYARPFDAADVKPLETCVFTILVK